MNRSDLYDHRWTDDEIREMQDKHLPPYEIKSISLPRAEDARYGAVARTGPAAMTRYEKIDRYLVARNADGLYFALDEDVATTTPNWVGNPIDAKLVTPHSVEDFNKPRPAPWYFENSDRMRRWLGTATMVAITIQRIATTAPSEDSGVSPTPRCT